VTVLPFSLLSLEAPFFSSLPLEAMTEKQKGEKTLTLTHSFSNLLQTPPRVLLSSSQKHLPVRAASLRWNSVFFFSAANGSWAQNAYNLQRLPLLHNPLNKTTRTNKRAWNRNPKNPTTKTTKTTIAKLQQEQRRNRNHNNNNSSSSTKTLKQNTPVNQKIYPKKSPKKTQPNPITEMYHHNSKDFSHEFVEKSKSGVIP
jgi:hypothetical protein